MRRNFLPGSDAELGLFTQRLLAVLTQRPGVYGIVDPELAAYGEAQRGYAEALRVAQAPGTRTTVAVTLKDTARRELVRLTRGVVRQVVARPGLSGADLVRVGLRPRERARRRVGRPGRPWLRMRGVTGQTVEVELRDLERVSRRGRPADTVGAVVLVAVGAVPPASLTDWRLYGHTNGLKVRVHCGVEVEPGAKVWVTAMWLNTRCETGPAAEPVSARVGFEMLVAGGGGVGLAA